jgi:L-ascorbate metabolism protein UlaG (beta-lactamase superfamily)
MTGRTITRRRLLKDGIKWCGMAAIPVLSSACGGRSAKGDRQMLREAQSLRMKEIAHRKLHHGDGCFLNLFGGPLHGNPWWPSTFQSVKNSDSILYNYSYEPYYKDERVVPVTIDWNTVANNPGLSITFIKHACIMIKDKDQHILIDPVFFDLPFIKGFSPLEFEINDMPAPTHVLISHGHYDHLDEPSLAALNPETHVISPLGYNDIFKDLKLSHRTQLDWYDTFDQKGLAIKLLPCMHWTMRNPLKGANNSLCGSFLIKTAAGPTIFISGDTSYFRGFREIGNEFSIDLAIINLGGYSHGAPGFMSHLNPKQAVKCFQELQAKHLLIVHWGSFRLTSEPVHFPPIQLKAEMTKAGLADQLLHLDHGETLYYYG